MVSKTMLTIYNPLFCCGSNSKKTLSKGAALLQNILGCGETESDKNDA